jgi:hypothetical protein
MKFFCTCCHAPTKKSGSLIKMCCICDDDYRHLQLEEILLGFHTDKVYLLNGESNNVYDKKDLYASVLNDR